MKKSDMIKCKILNVIEGKIIDTLRLQCVPIAGDIVPLVSGDYMVHARIHAADGIIIQCEPMEHFVMRQRESARSASIIKTPTHPR